RRADRANHGVRVARIELLRPHVLEHALERLAFDELEREEPRAAVVREVEHFDDVRMIERAEPREILPNGRKHPLVGGDLARQHEQRDAAARPLAVVCSIDHAEAAVLEPLLEHVAAAQDRSGSYCPTQWPCGLT